MFSLDILSHRMSEPQIYSLKYHDTAIFSLLRSTTDSDRKFWTGKQEGCCRENAAENAEQVSLILLFSAFSAAFLCELCG